MWMSPSSFAIGPRRQIALTSVKNALFTPLITYDGNLDVFVVPTEGVYRQNGRGGFPIDERFVFERTAGVGHTNLFGQTQLHEKVLGWLARA